MAGGRYGGLRDEVPRGDVEWDVGGGEDLDLDLEGFDMSLPRGVRREAAERSCRRRDEEAYMEGVRREHLGSAYMEEQAWPRGYRGGDRSGSRGSPWERPMGTSVDLAPGVHGL